MEDQADIVEHSVVAALRDPNAFVTGLGELEREGLLSGVQVNQEEGSIAAMILQPPGPALTPELQAKQSPKLGAYIYLVQNIARLWSTSREGLEQAFTRVQQKAA